MIDTRESLLGRLKVENAHEAWKEFYHLYWGAILRYARKLGLNEHQAEDVLQETMVALMRILPEFAYDRGKGRFRNFLLTIVHRKSLGVMRRVRRDSLAPWKEVGDADRVLEENDGRERDGRWHDAQLEERWREAVMEDALARLANDPGLAEKTWPVFRAYVIQNRTVAEVAAEFGLKENAVYQIKNRLLRRLSADVARRLRDAGVDEATG